MNKRLRFQQQQDILYEPDKFGMTTCQGIFGLINELLNISVFFIFYGCFSKIKSKFEIN